MRCEYCGSLLGESFAEQQERSGVKHTHANLPGRCTRLCPAYDVDVRPSQAHSADTCRDALRARVAELEANHADVVAKKRAGQAAAQAHIDKLTARCERLVGTLRELENEDHLQCVGPGRREQMCEVCVTCRARASLKC